MIKPYFKHLSVQCVFMEWREWNAEHLYVGKYGWNSICSEYDVEQTNLKEWLTINL